MCPRWFDGTACGIGKFTRDGVLNTNVAPVGWKAFIVWRALGTHVLKKSVIKRGDEELLYETNVQHHTLEHGCGRPAIPTNGISYR